MNSLNKKSKKLRENYTIQYFQAIKCCYQAGGPIKIFKLFSANIVSTPTIIPRSEYGKDSAT